MARTATAAIAAVALAQAGSAMVVDLPVWYRNSYPLVNLPVGTPPQDHLLHFDTGSGTSWMVSESCSDDSCPNGTGFPRNGYSLNASSTSRDLGVKVSVDYLGGATSGDVVSDMAHLGGSSWDQTFIAATKTSFRWIPGDGFLGMGFASIATPNTSTVVETMMGDGLLDRPRFAVYLGKQFMTTANGSGPGEGVLTLGGSSEAKYADGDLTWLPVRKDNLGGGKSAYQLWRSTLHSISASRSGPDAGGPPSSGAVAFAADSGANAVFDTGAGGIGLPSGAVADVYRAIGWDYDALLSLRHIPLCREFNASWAVTFTFSDDGREFHNLTIRGDQLATNWFAGREDACFPPFSSSDNPRLALVGRTFLRRFYTVFDYGAGSVDEFKPRIGFGQLKKEFQAPAIIEGERPASS
ncbi:hypothetical protein RB595_006982 [Gaeumannomyces hyphopodioides]